MDKPNLYGWASSVKVVRRAGLEPATRSLEGCCSNPTELPPRSDKPRRLPEIGQAVRKLTNQISKLAEISRKSAGHPLINYRNGIMGVQGLQVRTGDNEVTHP